MTPRKTFTVDPPKDIEPIGFMLTGEYGSRHPKAGEMWEEELFLVPELPVGAVALWQRTATSTGRATVFRPGPVIAFISTMLDDNLNASSTRFQLLCDDADRLLRLEDLVEVMEWAVQEVTGRPTGPATSSSDGQPGTGTGSEPELEPPESTPTT
jgi:hypothetical protein